MLVSLAGEEPGGGYGASLLGLGCGVWRRRRRLGCRMCVGRRGEAMEGMAMRVEVKDRVDGEVL